MSLHNMTSKIAHTKETSLLCQFMLNKSPSVILKFFAKFPITNVG